MAVQVPDICEIILIGFYQPGELTPFIEQTRREYPRISIRYLQEFAPLGTAGGIYHFRDQILMGKSGGCVQCAHTCARQAHHRTL
jgi:mannose-1-phosphate guanylyltransferase